MAQPAPCVIEPHYHRIRVLHKRREHTKHVIALFPGQAQPQRQIGFVYVEAELPPENDKHAALGRFMDTWSKFELLLRNKIENSFLSSYPLVATAVAYSVSGRALMDLLTSSGIMLSDERPSPSQSRNAATPA